MFAYKFLTSFLDTLGFIFVYCEDIVFSFHKINLILVW